MRKFINNTPFHAFFIAPALIFFLFVHNYNSTSFKSTIRIYEIALFISLIQFSVFYFLLKKNKHKAGVVTASMMLILFFYGFIYELAEKIFFKGWWPFSEIHRYIVLVIMLFVILLVYFLFHTKRTFHSLTYALNVFVLILFLINSVQLIISAAGSGGNLDPLKSEKIIIAAGKNDSLPDIYYIILDGYANDSVLSGIYQYKKNSLTDFLKHYNFSVEANSRTNYISTTPSLSSSLNFSYLDSMNKNTAEKINTIYNNKVSLYLKNKGYEIVHVRSGYAVTRENEYADTTITLNNLSEFERTMLRYSIFRLDDLLGYACYKTLKEQLHVMYDVFNVKGPKYVFLHIVSPHPPYVCDENGNFKSSPRVIHVWWEPKADYLAQLKYINKEVILFTSEIFKQSKVKPIVIIQSDHGPWIQSHSFGDIYNSRSMILNAFYIPYPWKNKLYSTITPVNSFRFIFKGLFNDSIPLLKDIPLDSASVKNNMNSNLMIDL